MCRPSQLTKGAVVRRFERGLGLRWTRAALKAELARAGRDHLVSMRDPRRRTAPLRAAKPCGPGRRCYGQAFREMPASPTGQTASSNSRGEGGQKESSAPGRARHRPSNHRAGKAGFWLPCVSPVHCVCIHSARGSLRVPAGARPSLRPFLREGEKRSTARANHAARTRALVRDLPARRSSL